MNDRKMLLIDAALRVIAATQGTDSDVSQAVKGDTAAMSYLAGKYGGVAVRLAEKWKKESQNGMA